MPRRSVSALFSWGMYTACSSIWIWILIWELELKAHYVQSNLFLHLAQSYIYMFRLHLVTDILNTFSQPPVSTYVYPHLHLKAYLPL